MRNKKKMMRTPDFPSPTEINPVIYKKLRWYCTKWLLMEVEEQNSYRLYYLYTRLDASIFQLRQSRRRQEYNNNWGNCTSRNTYCFVSDWEFRFYRLTHDSFCAHLNPSVAPIYPATCNHVEYTLGDGGTAAIEYNSIKLL